MHTIVWVVAGLLAFVAVFLRAGTVGLPLGRVLGPVFLLQAIAAVVIGRFESFPTIALAWIGIGILDQANTFQPGNRPAFNDVMLFVIVVVALLVAKRPTLTRAGDVSTWQAAAEVRPSRPSSHTSPRCGRPNGRSSPRSPPSWSRCRCGSPRRR